MPRKLKKPQHSKSDNTTQITKAVSSDLLSVYQRINNLLKPIPREKANVEAEKGETVLTDKTGDNVPELYVVGGKKHTQGGTPLDLPIGSFVYSDTPSLKIKDKEILKEFGEKKPKTPAEISKKYLLNKDKAVALNEDMDEITRKTALYNMEGKMDKLSKLALVQESMKGFPDGIPKFTYPYLAKNGIDPNEIEAAVQKQALLDKAKSILQYRSNNTTNPKMQDGGVYTDPNNKPGDDYIWDDKRKMWRKNPSIETTGYVSNFSWGPTSFGGTEEQLSGQPKPEGPVVNVVDNSPKVVPSAKETMDKLVVENMEPERGFNVSITTGFNPYEKMALDSYLASVHNADQMSQYKNIQESGAANKEYAASLQDKGDYVTAGSLYGFYRPNEVSGRRFQASSPYAPFGILFSKYGGLIRMDEGGTSNNSTKSDNDSRYNTYLNYFNGLLDKMKESVIKKAEDVINKNKASNESEKDKQDREKVLTDFKIFIDNYFNEVKGQSGDFVKRVLNSEELKGPADIFNVLTMEAQNHTNPFYSILSGNKDYAIIGMDVLKDFFKNSGINPEELINSIYGINNPSKSKQTIDLNRNVEVAKNINSNKSLRKGYYDSAINPVKNIAREYLDSYLSEEGVLKSISPQGVELNKNDILNRSYVNYDFLDKNGNFNNDKTFKESIKTVQGFYLRSKNDKDIKARGISVETSASESKSEGTNVFFSKPDGIYGVHTSNQTLLSISPDKVKIAEQKPEEKKEEEKKPAETPEVKVPDVKVPEIKEDKMPFFIQDKNNIAAALYNLGSIKKYYPVYSSPQYTAPTPSYYDYRRQEANIQEAGNMAAKAYQSLLPSQMAAAAIASDASGLATQAANAVANVQNQNTQIRNQYSQNLANIFNTLSQQTADRQQDYRNKLVTMQQQYDNARRQALGMLNVAYNTALTNAAKAYNLNLANLNSPFSINPTRAGALDTDKSKLEEWMRKNNYDRAKAVEEAIKKTNEQIKTLGFQDDKAKAQAYELLLKANLGNIEPTEKNKLYQQNAPLFNFSYPVNQQQMNMSNPYINQQEGYGYQYGGETNNMGGMSDKRPQDIVSKVKSILQSFHK